MAKQHAATGLGRGGKATRRDGTWSRWESNTPRRDLVVVGKQHAATGLGHRWQSNTPRRDLVAVGKQHAATGLSRISRIVGWDPSLWRSIRASPTAWHVGCASWTLSSAERSRVGGEFHVPLDSTFRESVAYDAVRRRPPGTSVAFHGRSAPLSVRGSGKNSVSRWIRRPEDLSLYDARASPTAWHID